MSELVIDALIGLLLSLVDNSHLEKLINNLEYELLSIEVLILPTDLLVQGFKADAKLMIFYLVRQEMPKLLSLFVYL